MTASVGRFAWLPGFAPPWGAGMTKHKENLVIELLLLTPFIHEAYKSDAEMSSGCEPNKRREPTTIKRRIGHEGNRPRFASA